MTVLIDGLGALQNQVATLLTMQQPSHGELRHKSESGVSFAVSSAELLPPQRHTFTPNNNFLYPQALQMTYPHIYNA